MPNRCAAAAVSAGLEVPDRSLMMPMSVTSASRAPTLSPRFRNCRGPHVLDVRIFKRIHRRGFIASQKINATYKFSVCASCSPNQSRPASTIRSRARSSVKYQSTIFNEAIFLHYLLTTLRSYWKNSFFLTSASGTDSAVITVKNTTPNKEKLIWILY